MNRPALPMALRTGYLADVLRVIDGDTFEARVRIWPGQDVTTKVRCSRPGWPAPMTADAGRAGAISAEDARFYEDYGST